MCACDLAGLDLKRPGTLLCLGANCGRPGFTCVEAAALKPGSIDDLVVVGSDPAFLEALWPLLATDGLALLAQAGGSYGRPISTPVGRVHYGNVRIVGTTGNRPADAQARIPATGEVREPI